MASMASRLDRASSYAATYGSALPPQTSTDIRDDYAIACALAENDACVLTEHEPDQPDTSVDEELAHSISDSWSRTGNRVV